MKYRPFNQKKKLSQTTDTENRESIHLQFESLYQNIGGMYFTHRNAMATPSKLHYNWRY